MFVKNKARSDVHLARGEVAEGLMAAALVYEAVYRIQGERLVPWEGQRRPAPTDPPTSAGQPLWFGTSVTVAGTARGPGRSPHMTPVELAVGTEVRRVLVFGDRSWVRNSGRLVPSVPRPWDELPLDWSLAYGGSFNLPPGPDPSTGLPSPGGRVVHPINPRGKGFYLNEKRAEGEPLPNIEHPDRLIRAPIDQPLPAGLSPSADLPGLRLPQDVASKDGVMEVVEKTRIALRLVHSAPGELIFPWLEAGTEVRVSGVGAQSSSFSVPVPPLRVSVRRGLGYTEVPGALRGLHISADDRAILATFAYAFYYTAPPSWVEVDTN